MKAKAVEMVKAKGKWYRPGADMSHLDKATLDALADSGAVAVEKSSEQEAKKPAKGKAADKDA